MSVFYLLETHLNSPISSGMNWAHFASKQACIGNSNFENQLFYGNFLQYKFLSYILLLLQVVLKNSCTFYINSSSFSDTVQGSV